MPASTHSTTTNPALGQVANRYLLALAFDDDHPVPVMDDPSWFDAFRMASSIHGLGPYLGLRTEQGDLEVPEPIDAWLRQQTARNCLRLARLRYDLVRILDVLTSAGVEPVPLKGAALLLTELDPLVWRPMSDLDVLVPGLDPRSLDAVLGELGYRVHSTGWKHRRYTSCIPGPPPVIGDGEHPDHPRDLEVHPRVVELFRGIRWDLTPIMLADPRVVTGMSHPIRIPTDAAMSLHLAVHASVHLLVGTSRAIQLLDLTRAIDRSGPEPLIDAARDAGIDGHARFLYPALAIAGRLTGHHKCQELSDRLAPWVTPTMRSWAASVTLDEVAGRHDQAGRNPVTLWARGPRERLAMLGYALFPGISHRHDVMRLDYAEHYRRQVQRLRNHFGRSITRP